MIKIIKTCKECSKIWTDRCPIRVWGRDQRRLIKGYIKIDVNPEKDYCSFFIKEIFDY